MKTNLKTLIAAFMIGAVTIANANNLNTEPAKKSFGTSIFKSDYQAKLNVFIDKVKGSMLTIVIRDSEGTILYEDIMGKSQVNYRSKFDLSKLEKGTYFIEINDLNNKEVKEIKI